MRTIVLSGAMFLTFNFLDGQPSQPVENTSLSIEIDNLVSNSGTVTVLLFNDPKGFPVNNKMAYKVNSVKIANRKATTFWNDLPEGEYAVSVFHDENENDEFDKSWFGSPQEGYGFSNIPAEFCGTPSFSQTSFTVNKEPVTIQISMIRP